MYLNFLRQRAQREKYWRVTLVLRIRVVLTSLLQREPAGGRLVDTYKTQNDR